MKYVHTHEVWFVIKQFHKTHIYVKSIQLRYEVLCIEKGDHVISQYLGRIQRIIDVFESIGDPVSHRDQLETILYGFPTEFQAFASITKYHDGTLCTDYS